MSEECSKCEQLTEFCECKKQKENTFVESALIGAVTDSAILGGLLGGDIVGGIFGDILDGDLGD